MKLSNLYCDVHETPHLSNPSKNRSHCIYGVKAIEGAFIFMTSANMNDLYLAIRHILKGFRYEIDSMYLDSQKDLSAVFGKSQSEFGNLNLNPGSERGIFYLYRGDPEGTPYAGNLRGKETLDSKDLIELVMEFEMAGFISGDFRQKIAIQIDKLQRTETADNTISVRSQSIFPKETEEAGLDEKHIKAAQDYAQLFMIKR